MIRVLAVAVLAASLTACSSGASSLRSSSSTTMAGAAAPTSAAAGATTTTSRHVAVAVNPSTPTRAVPAPTATSTPDALGGPGSGAPRYLRPARSTSIVVQALTQAGAEPRQASLDHLVAVLHQASGKPVNLAGGTVASSTTSWDDDALQGAATSRRPYLPAGAELMQYLFVHGTYRGRSDVLGITIAGDLTAIFTDQVDAAATGLVTPARIEESVTTHELGHLLGLVDLYLHTGRADRQHPGHSTDPHSVMYWAVESSVVGDLLTGGPPVDFDDADRADLATIRNG